MCARVCECVCVINSLSRLNEKKWKKIWKKIKLLCREPSPYTMSYRSDEESGFCQTILQKLIDDPSSDRNCQAKDRLTETCHKRSLTTGAGRKLKVVKKRSSTKKHDADWSRIGFDWRVCPTKKWSWIRYDYMRKMFGKKSNITSAGSLAGNSWRACTMKRTRNLWRARKEKKLNV